MYPMLLFNMKLTQSAGILLFEQVHGLSQCYKLVALVMVVSMYSQHNDWIFWTHIQ